MAALVVAMNVEVRLTALVELWSVIDLFIWIVDHASDAMAAIISVVSTVVARRVPAVMLILGHALNKRAEYGTSDDCTSVMTAMIIHSCIGIESVATTMVVATAIGENSRAALRDPDVLAARIVAPRPVQNTGASRGLVDKLRFA